jgi:GWxTD domain-containing protein
MTPSAVLLGLTLLSPPPDSLFARAESLLAAGRLGPARELAERLVRGAPADTRALLLLGRIHLAWPVYGRFHAESLFMRAAALEPHNPEPWYWLGHVGLALGGDDGEMIARPALVRLLALDPGYRDGWALWLRLYRGDRERRDAVTALARHDGAFPADVRRGLLLIELRRFDSAAALLTRAALRQPRDPEPHALLARALYEAGRDSAAADAYDAALRLAHRDTAGVLWLQVRSIASPGERAHYEALDPGGREAFLRQFWARRDPNLFTAVNERLGEHFRRYGEARRGYALLHPNAKYHRSRTWRALAGGVGGLPAPDFAPLIDGTAAFSCAGDARGLRDELAVVWGTGRPRAEREETPNLEDGLDDRGRIWVRYGRPDQRFVLGVDAETWCYQTPRGALRVTFMRRTGGWGASGDLVVTPVRSGEAEAAAYLLATDRPTLSPDQLRFTFWPASFRRRAGTATELVLFPESVTAIAVLVNENGVVVARDTATNRPLRLVAPPGGYLLLIDGERAGRVGRYRGSVPLPAYPGGALSVSGLLAAPGHTPARRDSLEAAAPAALVLPAERPLRLYAEVYGLEPRHGAVRYEATYRFERLDRGALGLGRRRVTAISFVRELPAAEWHAESIVVDPGRLPRGRYRVQLDVRDPVRGERAASSTLEFRLR